MSIGGDNDDSSTLSLAAMAVTEITVDGGANVKNKMMTYDVKSSAVVVESSSVFRRQQRRRRIRLKLQLLCVFIVILSLSTEGQRRYFLIDNRKTRQSKQTELAPRTDEMSSILSFPSG